MGLDTTDTEKAAESQDAELSAELSKILDNARRHLEDEFRKRLELAVQEAGRAAVKSAESEREQALIAARIQITAELRGQFEQTLQQTTSRMEAEFEERMRTTGTEWEAEKARLHEEMSVMRAYAEAQRQMGESRSQSEILGHFLDHAETFAPNLAVYLVKSDGLALWKTRGTMTFPDVVSKDTIDPEAYFKPIVVRERTIAAVCARQPVRSESLDFLSGALSRAIESFGVRLQSRAQQKSAAS